MGVKTAKDYTNNYIFLACLAKQLIQTRRIYTSKVYVGLVCFKRFRTTIEVIFHDI